MSVEQAAALTAIHNVIAAVVKEFDYPEDSNHEARWHALRDALGGAGYHPLSLAAYRVTIADVIGELDNAFWQTLAMEAVV